MHARERQEGSACEMPGENVACIKFQIIILIYAIDSCATQVAHARYYSYLYQISNHHINFCISFAPGHVLMLDSLI